MLYTTEHIVRFSTLVRQEMQVRALTKQEVAECPFAQAACFNELATDIMQRSLGDDETIWNVVITELAMRICFDMAITPYWLFAILYYASDQTNHLPLESVDVVRGIEGAYHALLRGSPFVDELRKGSARIDKLSIEQSLGGLQQGTLLIDSSVVPCPMPPKHVINPLAIPLEHHNQLLPALAWHAFPHNCCPWHQRVRKERIQ